jgi:hypothetical protein
MEEPRRAAAARVKAEEKKMEPLGSDRACHAEKKWRRGRLRAPVPRCVARWREGTWATAGPSCGGHGWRVDGTVKCRTGEARAADTWAPTTVPGLKPVQTESMNSNTFKFISNFNRSRKGIPKLKKIEIKHCFEEFEESNDFIHWKFSIFKMDFK